MAIRNSHDRHPGIEYHEKIADSWSAKYDRGLFKQRAVEIISSVLKHGGSGQRWLDAGCGSGVLSERLASHGYQVIGVDASPAMIEAARTRMSSSSFQDSLKFRHVTSVESLDFPSCSFDGILCSSVLEYLDSPNQCLREFNRLLKPNGLVVCTVPNMSNLLLMSQKAAFWCTSLWGKPWPSHLAVSHNHYTTGGIKKEAVAARFEFIESHGTSFFPACIKTKWTSGLIICVLRKE